MAVDLIYHSTYGQNRKIRKCLRDGIDVDALNFREENSLLHAAGHGQAETVKLLLAAGSEPNRLNVDGVSPLLASAMSNKEKCAALLLEGGAVWGLQKMKNKDVIKFGLQGTEEEKENLDKKYKIEANEISVLNDSRSIDVFHMFRMKDCLVRGQHCVAKIQLRHSFHHHHVTGEQDDDWLLREFKTLRSLRHPHIVQPYFYSISNEKKYNILITEPISEGTLYHVMYDLKQTVSTKMCKKIVEEILLAMIFLQSKRIVHNFVNSTSVLIARDWQIKLGNFEYSHNEGEQRQVRRSVPVEEFHFPYLAPELIRDSEVLGSESSDVYSFGCLTWELLGRKRPWCWLERSDIISLAQINHPIALPIPPCWPRALSDTIRHATKLTLEERMDFKSIYNNVFLPSKNAENIPNVVVTVDSTEMKNKRNSGSHVQFCPKTESKYIGVPGADFSEYVLGTNTTSTSFRSNVSTTSADGKVRKGCLKMTSNSDAVIKRALPSTIITHNYSRCLCTQHSGKKNRDTKDSKPALECGNTECSNPMQSSQVPKEKLRESIQKAFEEPNKALTETCPRESTKVADESNKHSLIGIGESNSVGGVSKEEIIDVQTITSNISNMKQFVKRKSSSHAGHLLDVVNKHQRSNWSRLATKHESVKTTQSDKSLQSSFVRDFLALNMPSVDSHRIGPHNSLSDLPTTSYDVGAIEKEAVLQDIFRTAGRYEKKNWAKATILDRDTLGNRCYKSKSWCTIDTAI